MAGVPNLTVTITTTTQQLVDQINAANAKGAGYTLKIVLGADIALYADLPLIDTATRTGYGVLDAQDIATALANINAAQTAGTIGKAIVALLTLEEPTLLRLLEQSNTGDVALRDLASDASGHASTITLATDGHDGALGRGTLHLPENGTAVTLKTGGDTLSIASAISDTITAVTGKLDATVPIVTGHTPAGNLADAAYSRLSAWAGSGDRTRHVEWSDHDAGVVYLGSGRLCQSNVAAVRLRGAVTGRRSRR